MALSCGNRHRLFWRSVLPKGQTYVYFLQAEINGGVKIGVANRVGARVRTLQTGNEHELRILAVIPAPPSAERAYHRLLSEERSRNENAPVTQRFVDPATMDRTPSRIRSFEPPTRLDEAA